VKDWVSEHHDKMRPHPPAFADTMVDTAMDKEKGIQQAYERFNANRARKKLQRLVNQKFAGSVDILFTMTDTNHDGEMDFEEFSAILKRQQLENLFGRKEQRDIFKAMDSDHTEKVSMPKLVDFLKGESEGFPLVVRQPLALNTPDSEELRALANESPYLANVSVARGMDMHFTTSAAERTPAQELKKRAEKSKEGIVRKIVEKRRLEKNEDGTGLSESYVLNAFRQCDQDMSGSLSRSELETALGPKWLDLGISKADLDDFVEVADVSKNFKDGDDQIPYRDFLKELHMHDLEPSFNPVLEARERGLKLLRDRVKEPFKFQKEYEKMRETADGAYFASQQLHEASEEQKRSLRSSAMTAPADATATLPAAWNSSTKPVTRLPAPGSDKNPGNDGRPVLSAPELFSDLDRIGAVVQNECGKTLTRQSEHHSHDNSRVGVGSLGVDPGSGLYADSTERFSTTSLEYHAPLRYAPNQPVGRPGARCDSVVEAASRKSRRDARFSRSTQNQSAGAQRLKDEELMVNMDQDQRERTTAKASYHYLRNAYFKDLKLNSKEPLEVMAKKPNWPLFAKTYSTSKDTQLHDFTLLPDSRDMRTTYTQDIGAGRFNQTSFELQGAVVPDLHRTSMRNRW